MTDRRDRFLGTVFLVVSFSWLLIACYLLALEFARPTSLRDRLEQAVHEAASSGRNALDLVGATRFPWQELMVFPEGTPQADVHAAVARGWDAEHLEEGEVPDGKTLLVFADDASVLGSVAYPKSRADFSCVGDSVEPSDSLVVRTRRRGNAVVSHSDRAGCPSG